MAKETETSKEQKEKEQKKCFVMMPFSTPNGYEEGHFKKIYEQIIKPAIEKANMVPERVDENFLSTDIVAKIFKGITECDMAICDLSSKNPNVLYELGIRQAYNKPVLLIKDEKTDKIFDVGGLTTIAYESHRLYENVTEAIEIISVALKENLKNKESVVNIVKARLVPNIKNAIRPSSNEMDPNDQILSLLQSLTNDIDSIKNRMNNNSMMLDRESKKNIHTFNGTDPEFEDILHDIKSPIYASINMITKLINSDNVSDSDKDDLRETYHLLAKFITYNKADIFNNAKLIAETCTDVKMLYNEYNYQGLLDK